MLWREEKVIIQVDLEIEHSAELGKCGIGDSWSGRVV